MTIYVKKRELATLLGRTLTLEWRCICNVLMAVETRIYTVTVQEIKGNKVYVIRQVTKPGQFIVNPRVDVMQALSMAGGNTPFALLSNIVICVVRAPHRRRFPFTIRIVAKGKDLAQIIQLESGDVVVVP
jgi:polysaccharide export outer membrane protein